MERWIKSVVHILAAALWCCPAYCRTLTFDDVPSGTVLRYSSLYHSDYRVRFNRSFLAADHSDSAWGLPHSGANVLICAGNVSFSHILFGYYTPSSAHPDNVLSVGAYFSTDTGAMVSITAYYAPGITPAVPVANVVIGAPGESWDNVYVEIGSAEQAFNMLRFEGVNSSNDLLRFCADDMTITYIPEPSSLLAVGLALAGFGGRLTRRRT